MFTAAEETPWPGCDFFFGASGVASESGFAFAVAGFALLFPRRTVFGAFFAVVFAATGGILACLRFDGAGRAQPGGDVGEVDLVSIHEREFPSFMEATIPSYSRARAVARCPVPDSAGAPRWMVAGG
jgi:hypothetical protein